VQEEQLGAVAQLHAQLHPIGQVTADLDRLLKRLFCPPAIGEQKRSARRGLPQRCERAANQQGTARSLGETLDGA